MKYHALFVIFEKKQQNLKLSSATNYRCCFKANFIESSLFQNLLQLV